MNPKLKYAVFSVLLFAFFMASGGATAYSHFCKHDNVSFKTYSSTIDHVCEMEAEVSDLGCHKSEVPAEDCCVEDVRFETLAQVNSEIHEFVAILPIKFISLLIEKIEVPNHIDLVVQLQIPLPLNSKRSVLFQQFLF